MRCRTWSTNFLVDGEVIQKVDLNYISFVLERDRLVKSAVICI